MPNVVKKVGIGSVIVKPERLRALRDDTVKSLMESMTVSGLLQPIVLRPRGTTGYWLVAGHHRLTAAKKLKWESIPANIFDGMDAIHAELAEIDENLIRADLSPAEGALHLAARKPLYEKIHGKAKAIGGSASQRKQGHRATAKIAVAFTTDVAKKTGKAVRTIRLDTQRGEAGKTWLSFIAGTSLDKGNEIDALILLPAKVRTALIKRAQKGEKVSAKTELKQHERNEREKELATKITALPDKKYGVILADPEWQFKPYSRKTGMDRAADNHYPTSATKIIAARDVPSIAAKDCVLFLCATAPMLLDALQVMDAWGFDYKTNWELHKDRVITGYWNRNRHEHLLLGIRRGGDVPAPAPGKQWESVIEMKVGKHSAKPEAIHQMIEAYFPNLPKIELNARGKPRKGWDAWGNEVIAEAAE